MVAFGVCIIISGESIYLELNHQMKILYFILALLPLQLFAQKQEINYGIIKMAIRQIDTGNILLSNKLSIPLLQEEYIMTYEKELAGKIPLRNLRQIIRNQHNVISSIRLSVDTMLKDSLNGIQYLTGDRFQKVLDKNRKDWGKAIPIFFSIVSIPVFDNTNTYFVISYEKGVELKNKHGSHYLFKRINSKWILWGSFSEWES